MATGFGMAAVADPRLGDEADAIGKGHHGGTAADIREGVVTQRRMSAIYVDDTIQFEDYHYWANQAREFEKTIDVSGNGIAGIVKVALGKAHAEHPPQDLGVAGSDSSNHETSDEKAVAASDGSDPAVTENRHGVSEAEWDTAQRAVRTATWGSVFYLITTDILGPYNVPWAISNMGFGPGFALYTVFGGLACYSGLQLWQMFVGLDSPRYPLRNYGDLAFRIYGKWARLLVNILQSFQFFLNVALIVVSNGQGLAQMAQGASGNGYLCFILAEAIFTICGFVFGQIRTLQRLSWLSNIAVWLNVICIIMTMVVVHYYPPNYAAAQQSGIDITQPIMTSAGLPPGKSIMDNINGLMNCVFAYGGATLFNELMAEMRRPMDFWKGFLLAEFFIYAVYLIMGMVVYAAQGQYTYNVAYQGIPNSAYHWQTLGNAISFISALIAALLYGNIGIKVLYASVFRDLLKFPSLDERKGKFIWVVFSPLYWSLAFVVAGALPQIANLTSFVGAACILQFSYTFPPILRIGFNCQKDSMVEGEGFDPATGSVDRVDSGVKRWIRGFKVKFAWNTFDLIYCLGALATAGMGLWASIIGMHQSFTSSPVTPFTCTNPAG